MPILVIAEHSNVELNAATRKAVSAAAAIGGELHVLVAGAGCKAAAEQAAKLAGVAKVLHCDNAAYAHALAENMASLVGNIAKHYTHVLATATTAAKDYMPRVAAMLDVAQISEIIEVVSPDIFKRPIYAGNAIETVQSGDAVKILTVRGSAFSAAGDGGSASVETLAPQANTGLSEFVGKQETKSERPELASARIVVSGGRGFGSAENFTMIERLADKLGAAIGASRAAVDAGYVPNDYQVGQTGKVVAPDLYIAIGISGAIQHLAGMKDSKVIVAINKDENAPIFEIADYGLVGDLFEILPELEKAL